MSEHRMMISCHPASFTAKLESLLEAYGRAFARQSHAPFSVLRLIPGSLLVRCSDSLKPNDLLGDVLYSIGESGKLPQGVQVYSAVIDSSAPYIGRFHQYTSHDSTLDFYHYDHLSSGRSVPQWASSIIDTW